MTAAKHHPYYPRSAPIENYQPNETPLWILAGSLAGIIAVVLSLSLVLAKRTRRRVIVGGTLGWGDQICVCWFALCGFLHCCFEGYFVLNHGTIASSQSLFGQLWKEYSLSDSRYMSRDLFLVTIESLTVLTLGPLSVAAAVCIARNSSLRYLVQAVVCSMHLYSVALYYGICLISESAHDLSYSRPEVLYYWVYFIGFNAPWVIVPAFLLSQSSRAIKEALEFSKAAQSQGDRLVVEKYKKRK